jgi:hypothetical protein
MSPRLLLRLHRIGLIAMAYFGIFYMLVNSAAFPIIAGKTHAAQEAFGHSVTVLGATFAWLLPLPVHPETAAGYLQWRGYGFFAIIFPAWGLLSAWRVAIAPARHTQPVLRRTERGDRDRGGGRRLVGMRHRRDTG